MRRELARARQPLEVVEAAQVQTEQLSREAARPVERQIEAVEPEDLYRPVRLGDKVRLRSLNTQGVVTSLGTDEAEVQVGVLPRAGTLERIAGGGCRAGARR